MDKFPDPNEFLMFSYFKSTADNTTIKRGISKIGVFTKCSIIMSGDNKDAIVKFQDTKCKLII